MSESIVLHPNPTLPDNWILVRERQWFDSEKAEQWSNESRTERLWRTRKGTFVRECDYNLAGGPSFYRMSQEDAAWWLLSHDHGLPSDLLHHAEEWEI